MDSYKILVSEVMLQQTQVSRVIPYYIRWVETWPTVQALARASRPEVLRAWLGLGYNSRAVRLQQASRVITHDFGGDVLAAMQDYQKVPGVGRYTAQAVLIFATNADLVTVDTNIRRILLASFGLPASTADRDLWDLALRCLPKGRSREWHNALMDYGALQVTARRTNIPPKTRQSKFEGSSRQLRAQVLRVLLDAPRTTQTLQQMLCCDEEALSEVLLRMCQEGILTCDGARFVVASD